MFRKFRLVLAAIALVLATLVASKAVSAAVPPVLLPPGTSRYAVVSAVVPVTTLSNVFVDVPGLSQTLTIPAGKTADVMIYFCGETRTKTLMTVRAVVVGSGIASPPFMQVRELTPAGQLISQCANFYRMKMTPPAAGPLTVKIQWHGAGGALQEMRNRSMILVVNYH